MTLTDRKITVDWRGRARRLVEKKYQEALQVAGPGARKIRRYITGAYPEYAGTTVRKKYPYRVWQEEVARVMEAHMLGGIQLRLFNCA